MYLIPFSGYCLLNRVHEDEIDGVMTRLQNHAKIMKCKKYGFNELYLRKGKDLFYFLMQRNTQYHETFIFPLTNTKLISLESQNRSKLL
jgi:hypothetical protein